MAVAFTREEDHEARAADVPDRPVSPHPNLVTASGLAAIEAELAAARAAYAAAQAEGSISSDRTAMARATRDLRYWSARRASAQLTEPEPEPGKVQFGRTVEVERDDGRRQLFRIVGEDEADPAQGRVS
jgi:transcription elongation GreA/GreB family factor